MNRKELAEKIGYSEASIQKNFNRTLEKVQKKSRTYNSKRRKRRKY